MQKILKLTPARIIAFGFAAVILVGSLLLYMPFSLKVDHVAYIDALYTSVSAVCVTGLVVVDAFDTYNLFGQIVIAALIQIGGLGVTCIGAGIIIAMGKKVSLKGRKLIQESMNLFDGRGLVIFVKSVFLTALTIEGAGALLSFITFSRDFPFWRAVWTSIFHSIAAFNNSGFDILGGLKNLADYKTDVLLNLVTAFLIISGGIGFLVIRDLVKNKFNFKKLSLHSRVVITVSACLIVFGTVMLLITDRVSVLGAFFTSVSTRTAGFSTYPIGKFSNAGLLIMIMLMFVGASSGSTGGGIKTGTLFVLIQGIRSAATNKSSKAFHYSIPKDTFIKASVIAILAAALVMFSSFLVSLFEPSINMLDIVFEMTSAFGTVGLSTGISPNLTVASKVVTILVMYTGRLGPLTVASLWSFGREERTRYPEGNIAIG